MNNMFILAHIGAAEGIIMHNLTIICLISSQIRTQMIFELLGNGTVPDACQHVEVTQTKEAVESAGNFLFFWFFFFPWRGPGPAVSVRLLCEGNSPGLPHLSVSCIRCSFALSWRDTANRCLHLPGLRGALRERKRERSDVVISHFKIWLFTSRAARCKAAQPFIPWF